MAKWNIDPDHSVAAFKVCHLTAAFVHGQFNHLSGSVSYNQADPAGLFLEVTAATGGLYTGIAQRDEHLKSADFFDAAVNPTLIFTSKKFTADGKGGKLSGDLTIRGVTKPVILDLTLNGPVIAPEEIGGETTLGIIGTATINREDFGMIWNVPLAGGGLMVGREIAIALNIEADLEE